MGALSPILKDVGGSRHEAGFIGLDPVFRRDLMESPFDDLR